MGKTSRIVRKTYIKIPNNITGPTKVKVGFPAGKASADNVAKAIYNEFGTRGSGKGFKTARGGGFGGPIPERPFMRNAARDNEGKYTAAMGKAAETIIREGGRTNSTMQKLGVMAQGDIQAEIIALRAPPNSPLTISLKGSSNPLIDTGEMVGSVTFQVED